MQDMRFYLLIEDKAKESEVRIDGNLQTFRELIYALRAGPLPANCLSSDDPKQSEPTQKQTYAATA